MNVFIADDDRIIVQGLRKMILDLNDGFTVIGSAYNGEDALEKLLSSDVDLLITDIKMPIMDGLELIQKIKLHKPEIRIIVLSVFDEYHFIRSSLKGGATDYLLKPINRDEFYDVLQGLRKECEDHTSMEEQQLPHSQQSEAPNVNSIIKKQRATFTRTTRRKSPWKPLPSMWGSVSAISAAYSKARRECGFTTISARCGWKAQNRCFARI